MVRRCSTLRSTLAWAVTAALIVPISSVRGAEPSVNFTRDVKPILARKCFACHGPTASEGGLRLDDPAAALAELDSGLHAIVPGDVTNSELVARVAAEDEALRMPLEGKPLAPEEVETLKRWIAAGAKWEKHWAFVPPERHEPPAVERQEWVTNPIDAFILAGLERAGLEPADPADARTLARRAYFGVTGLPPTSEQLAEFLEDYEQDPSAAWAQLIDSLLDSPHYGEHWARHWLDLVRFAETNSYERDGAKPNAWKYRDYVIRSFNEDKPYDQFLREQLAGDELPQVTDETIIATGYYRLGVWDDEPADPLQARYDELDDIISTTSQTMLGLTVGCARCHDHKIDPIPQTDYYGLLAFFADLTSYGDIETRTGDRNSLWDLSDPKERKNRAALRRQERGIRRKMRAIEETGISRMTAGDQEISRTPDREKLLQDKLQNHLESDEWNSYKRARESLEETRKEIEELPEATMALAIAQCIPHPEPTHVMLRGNPHVPGDQVEPHFPALFGDEAPEIPPAPEGARSAGRRRVLAEWIASPENMLTARVIVNRVWQHHFGRGIVRSANNFGEIGTPPTHPELLDWLALWLIDHDWKLKPLHRLIMSSSAYRMSSAGNERALALDTTNDLFWRFDMRRLNAEEIRDATLVVSGQLNRAVYGPSIYPALSREVLATQSQPGSGWGHSTPEERARRSVYIYVKRSLLTPLLVAFDFPDVDSSCEARFVTTQPGQSLAMLHGDFLHEQAAEFAQRVASEAGREPREQVAYAIQLAMGRAATEAETRDGLGLIRRLRDHHGKNSDEALKYWCLTVLNMNEFVYLD
jgi:hypothetical protein